MNDHLLENDEKRLHEARQYWDTAAPTFDHAPDHGLRDPAVRDAWMALLNAWLPLKNASVLDMGCGTGSLSVLLAGRGHGVTGIDWSPAMIALAQDKAASQGLSIDFQVMDAAFPQFPPASFDVVICRHLLWALPDPEQVLLRWSALLRPSGRLILIEGHWGTGSGLYAREITAMLPADFRSPAVHHLSDTPALWGGPVTDERYAIIADRN